MDAAGVGKIITISQALFEGITQRNWSSCLAEYGPNGPYPGGCLCSVGNDCISGTIRTAVMNFGLHFSCSMQYDGDITQGPAT